MKLFIAKFCLIVAILTPQFQAQAEEVVSDSLDCSLIISAVGGAVGMNQELTYESLLNLEKILSAQLMSLKKSRPEVFTNDQGIEIDNEAQAKFLKLIVRTSLQAGMEDIDWKSLDVPQALIQNRFNRALDFIDYFIDKNMDAIMKNSENYRSRIFAVTTVVGAFLGAAVDQVALGAIIGAYVGTNYNFIESAVTHNEVTGAAVRDEILIQFSKPQPAQLQLVLPQ